MVWLPKNYTHWPITPKGSDLLCQVSELVDPSTGDWDVQLVRDTFLEEDARIILAILLTSAWENSLAWHYDPRGMYVLRQKCLQSLSPGDHKQAESQRGHIQFEFDEPAGRWRFLIR